MIPKNQYMVQGKAYRMVLYLWAGALLMLVAGSLMPHAGPPDTGFWLDKILHIGVYGYLACCPVILFRNRKTALFLAVAMAPLGLGLEIGQMQIGGRDFSAADLLANNTGVVIGLVAGMICRLKMHYARRREGGST
jgi:VanZ family protein